MKLLAWMTYAVFMAGCTRSGTQIMAARFRNVALTVSFRKAGVVDAIQERAEQNSGCFRHDAFLLVWLIGNELF